MPIPIMSIQKLLVFFSKNAYNKVMRILIAPDSFKELADAATICSFISRGIASASQTDNIVSLPLSDGGDGALKRLCRPFHAHTFFCTVSDPFGKKRKIKYGYSHSQRVAIVEIYRICGIHLVPSRQRNPLRTSSKGVGEAILHILAAHPSCDTIILCLGGSCISDCGSGMLSALGIHLLDKHKKPIPSGGGGLALLQEIQTKHIKKRVRFTRFLLLGNPDTHLLGKKGTLRKYTEEKGGTPAVHAALSRGFSLFAECAQKHCGKCIETLPGSGASGGIGAAAIAFLDAVFIPGFDFIARLYRLEEKITWADVVITGEGRVDANSAHKLVARLARICYRLQTPLIVITGEVGKGIVHTSLPNSYLLPDSFSVFARHCMSIPGLPFPLYIFPSNTPWKDMTEKSPRWIAPLAKQIRLHLTSSPPCQLLTFLQNR